MKTDFSFFFWTVIRQKVEHSNVFLFVLNIVVEVLTKNVHNFGASLKHEVTFSYGLLHMDMAVLADQQRLTSALYEQKMQTRRSAKCDGL